MLVLSRKIDDTIIIGDNIQIKVVQIKGNRIRIGVEAPADVKILRGELAPYGVASDQEIDQATESAAESPHASKPRFANSAPVVDIDVTHEELQSLPNPFAQAS